MMKTAWVVVLMGIVILSVSGCATSVRVVPDNTVTTVTTDPNIDPNDGPYEYSEGLTKVTIYDPYDYYFLEGGIIYHYDHFATTRIVVVGQPPMDRPIYRHRIPEHYYDSHPPSRQRFQRYENQQRNKPPRFDGPPAGTGQRHDRMDPPAFRPNQRHNDNGKTRIHNDNQLTVKPSANPSLIQPNGQQGNHRSGVQRQAPTQRSNRSAPQMNNQQAPNRGSARPAGGRLSGGNSGGQHKRR